MPARDPRSHNELHVRIRTEWVELTDDDVREGLAHRDTFLQRISQRHHIGLDEAENLLRSFEAKNPELMFERS